MAFPETPLDVTVELLLNGSWVDITGDVLVRDGITISRGRSDWAERVDASRCQLTINNGSGDYSPRNPLGTHYGYIGRSTPIRVWIDEQGVTPRRFVGEVSEWPVRWDPSGSDVFVPVEAYGILRKLGRGAIPLRSVLYRSLFQFGVIEQPVAYWPCEDGSDSTALWSALPTQRPMAIESDLRLSSFSEFACSGAIPVLDDTQILGDIPAYDTSGGAVTALCLVHLPDDGLAQDGSSLMVLNGTGTGVYWRVQANMDGTVRLQVADSSGTAVFTSSDSPFSIGSSGALVGVRLTVSGANTTYGIRVYNVGEDSVNLWTGTVTSRSFGRITRITIGATRNLGQTAVGHVVLYPDTVAAADMLFATTVNAYIGETAGRRIDRLCQEEQIPLSVDGEVSDLDDTQRLGPQTADSTLNLLFEAADADGGILYEPSRVIRGIGTFEDGTTEGWVAAGDTPPTVAVSTSQAHTGTQSLEITWPGGASGQYVEQDIDSCPEVFIPGVTYTWTVWVYVPTGSDHVTLGVSDASGPTSTLNDQWEELTHTFTATDANGRLQIHAADPTTAGNKVYVDDLVVTTDKPGLAYRPRVSLYNDTATLELDYTAGEVAPPLEPVDDDQLLVNDVEVTREDGSSARVEVTTGPLSTAEPPDGVGRYRGGGTYNVETDADAQQVAAWLAHLGTWDEQRYPRISVDLKRNPALIPDATSVDVGDRVTIDNAPEWLPPELIDQQAQGYTEDISAYEWTITYTCVPDRPFQVAAADDRRADSDYSTLDSAIDTDDTVIDVTVETGRAAWIDSTDWADQFPFTITVGGEDMTVTAATAPSSGVQTFTVTRSANGIVKDHAAGTQVRLAHSERAYVAR